MDVKTKALEAQEKIFGLRVSRLAYDQELTRLRKYA